MKRPCADRNPPVAIEVFGTKWNRATASAERPASSQTDCRGYARRCRAPGAALDDALRFSQTKLCAGEQDAVPRVEARAWKGPEHLPMSNLSTYR
jgi:hypothetical protein